MSRRNVFEFRSEGWNWREAIEDDSFFVLDGEKVHPCHFSHIQQQKEAEVRSRSFSHCPRLSLANKHTLFTGTKL